MKDVLPDLVAPLRPVADDLLEPLVREVGEDRDPAELCRIQA